jgi:hypothetical protein
MNMNTQSFIGTEHDFDFLIGHWAVSNRRLRHRGVGSSDWDSFPAECQGWALLGGGVSVDEIHFSTRGFSGCTLRTLDRAARRWSIYWINSSDGRLFPPVHGGFHGPRGEFYGDDMDDGRAVKVRFVWTREGVDEARWEQAFSPAGAGWETNWVMEFRRGLPQAGQASVNR